MGKVPRAIMLLALAASLAGCASLAVHWEKPGADQATLTKDMADCRTAAREEAMRNYYPDPWPLYGPRRWFMWQQYSESQRFFAESSLTRFCMRNKGYELVPDQPATKSTDK